MINIDGVAYNGPYDMAFDVCAYKEDVPRIPEKSGIYCMYSIKVVDEGKEVVDKLEYIGKALNLHERIAKHIKVPELDAEGRPVDKKIPASEYLYNHENPFAKCFYTYAFLDGRSLKSCEAAMIKRFKPAINTNCMQSLGCHESARIVISGSYLYDSVHAGTFDVQKD